VLPREACRINIDKPKLRGRWRWNFAVTGAGLFWFAYGSLVVYRRVPE
jgi:hypothetical protein